MPQICYIVWAHCQRVCVFYSYDYTSSDGFWLCLLSMVFILSLQDTGVGKSSIVWRFVEDSFDPNINPTIGYVPVVSHAKCCVYSLTGLCLGLLQDIVVKSVNCCLPLFGLVDSNQSSNYYRRIKNVKKKNYLLCKTLLAFLFHDIINEKCFNSTFKTPLCQHETCLTFYRQSAQSVLEPDQYFSPLLVLLTTFGLSQTYLCQRVGQ